MSDARRLISWLLLVLVGVVGVGAAVLGVSQAPKNAGLLTAVDNTKNAPSYTQVVTEKTPQGAQTDHLVWQAPDRLGGYIQSGSKRTYVYILPSATGPVEYQSITQSVSGSTKHLIFYRQAGESAASLDPTQNYLRYPTEAKNVTQSGNTYTFSYSQTGSGGNETGTFVYTVTGPYVSQVHLTVETSSVQLVISAVGSSPPVNLPPGSKVVSLPGATTPGAGAAG
jgi:hypothetical protein